MDCRHQAKYRNSSFNVRRYDIAQNRIEVLCGEVVGWPRLDPSLMQQRIAARLDRIPPKAGRIRCIGAHHATAGMTAWAAAVERVS